MRKFIGLVLFLCILSTSAFNAFSVKAESPTSTSVSIKDGYPYFSIVKQEQDNNSFKVDKLKKDLCEKIYNALVNGNIEIYISDLNISISDENEEIIDNCFFYLMRSCPYLFDWSGVSYSYYDNSYIYTRLEIESESEDFSNLSAKIDDYNNLLDRIIDTVPKDSSDLSKMLYIYDYIALNYEYDTTYTVYDGYTFLKTGAGVCQAYSEVFSLLMYKLGIPCTIALDDSDGHAWNVVQLNGKYYHIDTTWADPVPNTYGYVSHKMFMLSDNTILDMDLHSEYFTFEELFGLSYSCNDNKYESNYLWNNSVSKFAFYNGQAYYVSEDCSLGNDGLKADICKTEDYINSTEVTTITDTRYLLNESGKPTFKSGISIIGNQIYYNTTSEIRYYDIDTGNTGVVFSDNSTDYMLYTHYKGNGLFQYSSISIGINNGVKQKNKQVSVKGPGDLNGDGRKDAIDITILRNYILNGSKKGLCLAKFDGSTDNQATVLDLVAQKRLCLLNQ